MEKTIKQLRREGWKVKVNHYRRVKENNRIWSPYRIREMKFTFEPRGGLTLVEVRSPDGKQSDGAASCSTEDSYNKKIGVRIALGRALSKLKLAAE